MSDLLKQNIEGQLKEESYFISKCAVCNSKKVKVYQKQKTNKKNKKQRVYSNFRLKTPLKFH